MKLIKTSGRLSASTRRLLSVMAFMACSNGLTAQERSAELQAPTLLRSSDGKLIDMLFHSVPTIADIDRDGKSDLVIGQFMNYEIPSGGSAGSATWYRNESKGNELPTYAKGVNLRSESGLVYAENW